MVGHILKISRPGVFELRCLSWNTAIIVFKKNGAWIEDDIKAVTEFPCLLVHSVYSELNKLINRVVGCVHRDMFT